MKVFEDKVYNEMDWLEAACQPINDELNKHLSNLPNEIVVDLKAIGKRSFDVDDILSNYAPTYSNITNRRDRTDLVDCFAFEIEGKPTLNTQTNEVSGGTITLKKIKEVFTEEEIEKRLGHETISRIHSLHFRKAKREYINEILELLGLHDARSSRSMKVKCRAIQREIEEVFSKNKWKIRDMRLSNVVGEWLVQYIHYGNLAALSNFCKLKGMIHSGQPIYSINEEQEV